MKVIAGCKYSKIHPLPPRPNFDRELRCTVSYQIPILSNQGFFQILRDVFFGCVVDGSACEEIDNFPLSNLTDGYRSHRRE
jgi:hypothetical protein